MDESHKIIHLRAKQDGSVAEARWQRYMNILKGDSESSGAIWTALDTYIQEIFKENLGLMEAKSIAGAVVKRLQARLCELKLEGATKKEILDEFLACQLSFTKEELQTRGWLPVDHGQLT